MFYSLKDTTPSAASNILREYEAETAKRDTALKHYHEEVFRRTKRSAWQKFWDFMQGRSEPSLPAEVDKTKWERRHEEAVAEDLQRLEEVEAKHNYVKTLVNGTNLDGNVTVREAKCYADIEQTHEVLVKLVTFLVENGSAPLPIRNAYRATIPILEKAKQSRRLLRATPGTTYINDPRALFYVAYKQAIKEQLDKHYLQAEKHNINIILDIQAGTKDSAQLKETTDLLNAELSEARKMCRIFAPLKTETEAMRGALLVANL